MSTSTQFATAVQLLAILGRQPEVAQTSKELAKKLSTHPVVVRRLLVQLGDAELVLTRKGPGGGSILAQDPDAISLATVSEAVSLTLQWRLPAKKWDRAMRKVNTRLADALNPASRAFMKELSAVTIADMLR